MDATSSLVISDVTPCSGLNLNNLLVIPTQNVNSVPCQLCFCLHNTRLVGSAANHDVDVKFITEIGFRSPVMWQSARTWLHRARSLLPLLHRHPRWWNHLNHQGLS